MKVILQQDVKGQGKKGQMIEASDGYARNFLLPRKLAVPATAENVNTMKMQDKAKKAREAEEKAQAQALSEKLQSCPVKIAAKAGQGGRLFGSITSKEISEELKKQYGLDVNKSKLVLPEPLKAFGSYEVKCKLGYEITGTVYVLVVLVLSSTRWQVFYRQMQPVLMNMPVITIPSIQSPLVAVFSQNRTFSRF